MTAYIDAIEGPLKGKSFVIQEGYTIGRTQGEILLDDSKVSGTHAKASLDPLGNLVLMDLGSANGLRVAEQKVQKVVLKAGTQFILGRSVFRVRLESLSRTQSWQEILTQQLKELEKVEKLDQPKRLKAFKPALNLRFIQGIQADEELTLGYGPRTAGLDHIDLCLWEPGIPEICFHLDLNDENAIELKVQDAKNLLVNGTKVKRHPLQEGDVISLGNTQLKVSFVKESS